MTPLTVEAVRAQEEVERSAGESLASHPDSVHASVGHLFRADMLADLAARMARVCVSCKWAGHTYKTGPYVGYRDCMMPAVTSCANLVPLTAPSGEPMGCPCWVKKEGAWRRPSAQEN